MHIRYVANARIPTEKAHGLTIVKSCEAFARAGATVELIVPKRKTRFAMDVFETYGVKRTFTVTYLPVFDLLRFSGSRAAFWGSYLTFYLSAFLYLLFASKKDSVIYTREAPLLSLSVLGMPAVLECHHVFEKGSAYFKLARRARGIVTISASLKEKFLLAGFDDKQVLVAPSGVDLSIFENGVTQSEARHTLGLPRESALILYTGNFTTMGADKGISDVLRALPQLPGVTFIAVGGSEGDCARYSKEASTFGVESRVKLHGFAPQTALALYQKAADILLMPFPDTPHYRSNMSPVKMFEYMASGRPIIATDLPTIREVLTSDNAIIIPPGDSAALADAVKALLADPGLGHRLAQQAQQQVNAYAWSERAKKVLAFIESKTENI